jgi:regulatory protein
MAFGRGVRRRVDEHRAADAGAVRAGALALLTRREYASAELAAALSRKGYATQVVQEVVAALAGENLVDDTRYAESLVRMLVGRGQGPARIRQELRAAGLADAQIAAALDSGPDWQALAAEVRRRKFGAQLPREWPERARQMRFLQYRGFSGDHVARALEGAVQEEDLPPAS